MDLIDTLKGRRSIRKFKKDAVAEGILREILEDARLAPSWGNTQPWKIYVVTGEILEKIKRANRKQLLQGNMPAPEVEMPQNWPEALKKRYVEVGKNVLSALGVPREDKQARLDYTADMFALFDAPVFLLLCVDKSLPIAYAMLDTGLILQTLCLLATEKGLGTCIMASSISYPSLLRKFMPISESETIVIGVALGYPDGEAPVNQFSRERAGLEAFVTWVK